MEPTQHNQKNDYPHKRQRIFRTLFLFFCLLAFTACHFPQPTATITPSANQNPSEVSEIQNPNFVQSSTPLSNPALISPTSTEIPEVATLEVGTDTILYTTQHGDTLPALATRFDVPIETIESLINLSASGYLPIGLQVRIPDLLDETLPYKEPILPDSEVIYGPAVGDFDTIVFANAAGGDLSAYSEIINGVELSGPEIVQKVAIETSTNPRLLLGLLEYQSNWVFGDPPDAENDIYPIGFGATQDTGLYKELLITAKVLAQGFYGWRDGTWLDLTFFGGQTARLSPNLNAGSVALMNFFATLFFPQYWGEQLYGETSFLVFYQEYFGDYWYRAEAVETYLLSTVSQPVLNLPFSISEPWGFTGGPHSSWQTGTPWGAIDFAPITGEPRCVPSFRWATAAATGLVVRADNSVVALDLDGDGDEGTGWVLIYQHMAKEGRVTAGTWLNQDDPVGHPSCEGGQATGTHVHFTRKYNGEWMPVGEPMPMVLSGWRVIPGERRYEGTLVKGDQIVSANPNGMTGSTIIRDE
jgi:murein DD-endopeptidase MepM/ murein hydrolase activator NlpD